MFLYHFSAAKGLIDDYEPGNLSDPENHRVVQGLGTQTKSKLISVAKKRDEILRPFNLLLSCGRDNLQEIG